MIGDASGPVKVTRKGGGGQVTSTSGIAPEFKPYLESVLKDVTSDYKRTRGRPQDVVADFSPEQREAQVAQANLARDAISGTGLYDTSAQLNRSLAQAGGQADTAASLGGALSSARAQAARENALGNIAAQDLQRRQAAQAAGVQALGDVGAQRQAQAQRIIDAPHTSAQRYFGYLGSAPQQQTQTQPGGK